MNSDSRDTARADALLQKLLSAGKISPGIAQTATERCHTTGEPAEEVLVRLGLSEAALLQQLAQLYRARFVSTHTLAHAQVPRTALARLNERLAYRYQAVPLRFGEDETLTIATAEPDNSVLMEQIRVAAGAREVRPLVARPAAIGAALELFYRRKTDAFGPLLSGATPAAGSRPGSSPGAGGRSEWEAASWTADGVDVQVDLPPDSSAKPTAPAGAFEASADLKPPPAEPSKPRQSAPSPGPRFIEPPPLEQPPEPGRSEPRVIEPPPLEPPPAPPLMRPEVRVIEPPPLEQPEESSRPLRPVPPLAAPAPVRPGAMHPPTPIPVSGGVDSEVARSEWAELELLQREVEPHVAAQRSASLGEASRFAEAMVALAERGRGSLRNHSVRVARLAYLVCENTPEYESLAADAWAAGLLHDLGKHAGLHLTQLNVWERADHLTAAQAAFEQPLQLLRGTGVAPRVLNALLHLYERCDGKGFPDQLAADEIPVLSRLIAACDSWIDLALNPANSAGHLFTPLEAHTHLKARYQLFDTQLLGVISRLIINGKLDGAFLGSRSDKGIEKLLG